MKPTVIWSSTLRDATVAIVRPDDNGIERIFLPTCAGIWLGARLIVTAAHCVSENAKGQYFKACSELQSGSGEEFLVANRASVVRVAQGQALAFLFALGAIPAHSIATLSTATPAAGDAVYIVGHPAGYVFSFVPGTISATRTIPNLVEKRQKLIQISAPTYKGNSGGGAFNRSGRLVGICSFLSNQAPDMTFFVHTDGIREFL